MVITDSSREKVPEPGSDVQAPTAAKTTRSLGPRRKLTDEQEREVTRLYAETSMPVPEISRQFGIGESSVYRVVERHGATLRGHAPVATQQPPTPAEARPQPTGSSPSLSAGRRSGKPSAPRPSTARAPRASASQGVKTSSLRPTSPAVKGATAAHATRRSSAARAPQTPPTAPTSGSRRQFRVSFLAEKIVEAENIRGAIRQAEALGATEVTGIVLAV
jgi:transposase-like protein